MSESQEFFGGSHEPIVSPKQNKGLFEYLKTIAIGFSIVSLCISVALVGYAYTTIQGQHTEKSQTVCTQDAKICPDGSYVSRSGPNCEFEKCKESVKILPVSATVSPSASAIPKDWRSYSSSCGFILRYPPDWSAQKYFIEDSANACVYLQAPDYQTGLDNRLGNYFTVTRVQKGTRGVNILINSLDDYIKDNESMVSPAMTVSNKKDITIGSHTGVQFEPLGREALTEFIFERANYIYSISWPTGYTGVYKDYENRLIQSITF